MNNGSLTFVIPTCRLREVGETVFSICRPGDVW